MLLRSALRNSGRSVLLLALAIAFITWLGWMHGHHGASAIVLVIGAVIAAWRLLLWRRHPDTQALGARQVTALVRELEANAVLVGLMWVVATSAIYPSLQGAMATVYVVMICGSIATAAFFLSMAGRSFLWLTGLQLSALAAVSLRSEEHTSELQSH